ncbi:MAG: hypothetical protein DRG20_02255 [Deltaproteobacteria bacterium]|nr:MAG: hypothetical protein DRG20_02255 [Deltaproteobacteria bacterium]
MRKIVVIIAIFMLIVACARRIPPIPPDAQFPASLGAVKGIVKEGRFFITWRIPTKDVRGKRLKNLIGFYLLRNDSCKECPNYRLIKMIDLSSEKGYIKRGNIIWVEDNLKPGKIYYYKIVPVVKGGYKVPASKPIAIFWKLPPQPPKWLHVEGKDREVLICWQFDEGVDGYRIYRKKEGENFPLESISKELISQTCFEDKGLINGEKYIYTVRAVIKSDDLLIEGKGAKEVAVIPRDLNPPAPPKGLRALLHKNGILLHWLPNKEEDLKGYNIYRKENKKKWIRINNRVIEKSTYLDKDVSLGKIYFYKITALDKSSPPNESKASKIIKVRFVTGG